MLLRKRRLNVSAFSSLGHLLLMLFYVGFKILSAVTMNTAVLWGETPSVPVDRHRPLERCSASCLRGIIFDPEYGGTTFQRNVGKLLPDNTTLS